MIYIRLAALAFALFLCVTTGLSLVLERQNNLDRYDAEVSMLEDQVSKLEETLVEMRTWAERLESDPLAWEEVARERMGYLAPGEVLVTWRP